MIPELVKNLNYLSSQYDIIGMKQSFEDEGVSLDDVITIRRITDLCNLQSFVKIGGCEAKTDVRNCLKFGVDVVIAPMIESAFALSKFINITSCHSSEISPFIVVESRTAYENLDGILDRGNGKIQGVVVGRSDLSKSYSIDKSEVDSLFVCDKVQDILVRCKGKLITTLGGNISTKSVAFIRKMYQNGLLDRIETRNVVIKLSEKNLFCIDEMIRKSLEIEATWVKYKLENSLLIANECAERIKLMKNRSE